MGRTTATNINRVRPDDKVRVEIENVNGDVVSTYKGSGFSRVEEAIGAAYEYNSELLGPMADYVYSVGDSATGVCHRYRINAGGNVKLIV